MAKKYVCIRLTGVPNEVRIEADSSETDGPYLIVKKDAKEVGRFMEHQVQGHWFIEG